MAQCEFLCVKEEIEEDKGPKSNTPSPLHCPTNTQDKQTDETPRNKRYTLLSKTSSKFWEIAQGRDEASRAVSSPNGPSTLRAKISGLAHKISWESLKKTSKEWFRNPMNIALFIWITCVAVSGAILFLVMTGMLNHSLPKKSQRNAWFEVNNQILNALFTLMCLYQHPQRFYHLALLLRWNSEDIAKLRKIYCKNGTYKPHEWAHMLVVVLLLHLNCFAQYGLCGLNLGYKRSQRPPLGVAVCISVAIAAPAIAGVYTILSPLGKDYEHDLPADEEAQVPMTGGSESVNGLRSNSLEQRLSFVLRENGKIVESQPKWRGGTFDLWEDISVAFLSLFCSFCVFGWNMERLGFGNMYVHIATFILFCSAPFWIFNLAALNIDDDRVRQALGFTGFILCAFGLLYGGYWRIRMRKRFGLPGNTSCCGKPAVSDCALWFCCCWCSLAQEVRTANSYEIVEDKMCRKQQDNGNVELGSSELVCEDGETTNHQNLEPSSRVNPSDDTVEEEDCPTEGMSKPMSPPYPLMIDRDGK
ncbi:Protein PLANT CADMIUM RESISTANCE 7 [Bienertia sinuspersici]